MSAICPHIRADAWLNVPLVLFQRFQGLPPQDKDLLLCGWKCRRHVPVSERGLDSHAVKLPQSPDRGQQSNSCLWPGNEPPPSSHASFLLLLSRRPRSFKQSSSGRGLTRTEARALTHKHTHAQPKRLYCAAVRHDSFLSPTGGWVVSAWRWQPFPSRRKFARTKVRLVTAAEEFLLLCSSLSIHNSDCY